MATTFTPNWKNIGIGALALVLIIFGLSQINGCSKKEKPIEDDEYSELNGYKSAEADLNSVERKHKAMERARNSYNRKLENFIIKNGGEIVDEEGFSSNSKKSNQNSNSEKASCETCPEDGRDIMNKAEDEANKEIRYQKQVYRMAGVSTSNTKTTQTRNTVPKKTTTSNHQPSSNSSNSNVKEIIIIERDSESSRYRNDQSYQYHKNESSYEKSYQNERIKEEVKETPKECVEDVGTTEGRRVFKSQDEKDQWFKNYYNSGGTQKVGERQPRSTYRKEVRWKNGWRLITSEKEYQQYLRDKEAGKDR